MRELISVIVPVFNRYEYLRDTVESVLNQSYENLEVILIDDGSSDYALNIMREYEKRDSRVCVFTQENKGISIAMRNAVLLSRGEYVARIDSDDVNDLYRYERQLEFSKEGNFDLVGCYINGFGSGNASQMRYLEGCVNKPMRDEEACRRRFLLGQTITGSTIFCRRDALLEVMPFHYDYSKIEDYYLTIMLYKAGKRISILEEKRVNYRVHDRNLSLTGDDELISKHTEVSFMYMFREIILRSKRIIIFRMNHDSNYLYKIITRHYYNIRDKFIIVDEKNTEKFLVKNIKIVKDVANNVVFYGVNFRELADVMISKFGYEPYRNIFMSGY